MGNWISMIYNSALDNELLDNPLVNKNFNEHIIDNRCVDVLELKKQEEYFRLIFHMFDKHSDSAIMKVCRFLDPYVLINRNRGDFIGLIQDDYDELGDSFDSRAKLIMKDNDYFLIGRIEED